MIYVYKSEGSNISIAIHFFSWRDIVIVLEVFYLIMELSVLQPCDVIRVLKIDNH